MKQVKKQILVQFIEDVDSALIGSFKRGQIVECGLLSYGTNWIRVVINNRVKTLFNFEAKPVATKTPCNS